MCARIAEEVDVHHGELGHDPPWSEILVVGVPLSAVLRQVFCAIGGRSFGPTADGFRIRRGDVRPEGTGGTDPG
jgi:hypothetical protein